MRNYQDHLLLSGSSIRDALARLDSLAIDSILFIVDHDERLLGSLSDGDVRRGLLRDISIEQAVDQIFQQKPKFIRKGERNIEKVINYRDGNYRILPILNKDDQVINVVNFRELRSYLPIDAVIMAGGKGMRLRPLTENTPKPLLHVGGKPIIDHNIDRLRLFGIDDFWITLNYLGDVIENYLGNGSGKNINIQFVREKEPLGTIGAVSLIDNFVHEYILVTNSDILTNLDHEKFFLEFLNAEADLSVVTIPYKVDIPYAVMETSNSMVTSFREKPTYTYFSNGGIYLMKREVLNILPEGQKFDATDLMEKLIDSGRKVVSFPLSGYWLDIGSYDDFNKAQVDLEHIKF